MLRDWFDAADEFNAARLVLLSSWSPWLVALVVIAVAAVVYLAWHNTAGQIARRRRLLVGLRLGTVGVLLLLFMQPGVRLEHVTRVRNHVVVLLDASRSMTLPAERYDARVDAVRAWMTDQLPTLERWRAMHQVDLFAVTDHARPLSALSELGAQGDATRLLSALEDVAARFQPEDLAAVILISDGADNGALGDAVVSEDDVPPAAQAVARRLGAPIHTVFTGPERPLRDVAIVDVAYDDFAFVRNAVSIEAEISVTGYDELRLPVTLRQGDDVLGTRTLETAQGQSRYHFDFEFVPDETGKAVFTLEVGQGPGERVQVNNRRQFVVRIIRDKIRVLQVVGRPSWDERFLRKLLKKNPNVDLISFFILRTGASIDVARRDELSLIPFPTRELFEEQLGSFDLIIFQNFTYRGYHMEQYLPLIRDYVRNGGGFVMLGGDLSFTSGGYAGTPIEDFLPVTLPADKNDLLLTGRFSPVLADAGRRHPITALSVVPEENTERWQALPKLSGVNRVTGLRAGAQALLEHPAQQASGGRAPVVAVAPFGRGRVLSVTTDSTWHWDFLAAGAGGDNRHYYKFWGNAIRWLIRDPALEPVQVEADRDRYPLGAEATLVTRVLGADYQPAVDAPVTVRVDRVYFGEGGNREREIAFDEAGRTDENGQLVVRLKPPADGAYFVRATATVGGADVADDDAFVVAPDPVELRRTDARRDTLRALAKAGGGEALTLDDDLDEVARNEPRVVKVNRRRDVPLWASGWLLLVAVLLPSTEWFLRRRWGLL